MAHYTTRFWDGTHPSMEKGEILSETYMVGDRAGPNAPRGTKGKLNELGGLFRKHYRFYNDGDAFTYKKVRVGESSTGMRRVSSGRIVKIERHYHNVERDNELLRTLEDDMARRIEELWVLTNGATK